MKDFLKVTALSAEEPLESRRRPGSRMRTAIDAQDEFEKWNNFDTRLIFTNCGALTWYLRKAWLLDNAPELMAAGHAAEAFEIRRTVRNRLAKSDHFSHIRIRARLAFAERLAHGRSFQHTAPGPGFWWRDQQTQRETAPLAFSKPGKPRLLKLVDAGHQWIYLKWKWPKSAVTRLGYRIERSTQKATGYQPVAVTHACDLVLLPLRSNTPYFYRVRAFNPAGDGPPSEPLLAAAF
jgi:hypothetical protein